VTWGSDHPYVPMNAVYRMLEPSHLLHAFLAIVRDEAATLSGGGPRGVTSPAPDAQSCRHLPEIIGLLSERP